jgi:hypothetical protein
MRSKKSDVARKHIQIIKYLNKNHPRGRRKGKMNTKKKWEEKLGLG